MSIIWSLIYTFLLFELTLGGHFDGGTIRWVPMTKNATASPVPVLIIQTYTYTLSQVNCTIGNLIDLRYAFGFNFSLWCTLNCGNTSDGYYAPPVLSYCTGLNAALDITFTQRSDIVNLTANDFFSISHAIPNATKGGFYRPLALSSGGNDTRAQWNITASIDIRARSDNGLINTSPLANIMSPYGIPYNIPTQIVIPTMDIDNDDVRCRWSNSTEECGDVCFPRTIPPTATISSDCILTITGMNINDWYCAPIQVEDFLNKNTSTPLSSVPVQFLIYVYQPKNCSIPILSSSLSCIGVQVGIPYTFTLTAINRCGSSSNISDIAVQIFSGIIPGSLVQITPNPNTTIYEMNVTYTPLLSQVGLQAICATALDNDNIPSDQYCITFIVDSTTVPVCPGSTTTTTSIITTERPTTVSATSTSKLLTTYAETTSIVAITSSKSSIMTSVESSQTTQIQITSQNVNITSSLPISGTSSLITSSTTQSTSKPDPINWPLIGTIAALMTLLMLLSCYCCYFWLWGAGSRRRRRRHKKTEQNRKWQPMNDGITDITRISQPRKTYQVHHIGHEIIGSLIKRQPTRFLSFTNSSITPSSSEIGQQQKEIGTETLLFRSSQDLCSSPKNDLTNSYESTVNSNQEHRPSVVRISHYELPQETGNNILLHRSSHHSTLSHKNTVKVARISFNDNKSTKDKLKLHQRNNSVSVTRVIKMKNSDD